MLSYALVAPNGETQRGTWLDHSFASLMLAQAIERGESDNAFYFDSLLEGITEERLFPPFLLSRHSSSSCHTDPAAPLLISLDDSRLEFDPLKKQLTVNIFDDQFTLELTLDLSTVLPLETALRREGQASDDHAASYSRVPAQISLQQGESKGCERALARFEHMSGAGALPGAASPESYRDQVRLTVDLDDGPSLVLVATQQAEQASTYDVLSCISSQGRHHQRMTFKSLDQLQSLRTLNIYSRRWQLLLDDNSRLEFEPTGEGSELYLFTFHRGLFVQPCTVSGIFNGRPCRGTALVESGGCSLDPDLLFWGQSRTFLSRQVEAFIPRKVTLQWLSRCCGIKPTARVDLETVQHALIDPIWSMIDRGGKGWRSGWLVTCCYVLSPLTDYPNVRSLLPLIELIHTGSLVIDDIQDESPLRRGKAALHMEMGTDLAINVGNFLYFLPMQLIKEAHWLDSEQRLQLYEILMLSLRQGHLGQGLDLMWSRGRCDIRQKLMNFTSSRDELLEQYRLKSGYHLEAVARIAGVITQASQQQIEELANFSCTFGVVFQIADDIIDLQEGQLKLGKCEGEDIRNEKLNCVLLYTCEALDETARGEFLRRAFDASDSHALDYVKQQVQQTRAVERCIELAEQLIDEAWSNTGTLLPSDAKFKMRSVIRWLLSQRKERQHELNSTGPG